MYEIWNMCGFGSFSLLALVYNIISIHTWWGQRWNVWSEGFRQRMTS